MSEAFKSAALAYIASVKSKDVEAAKAALKVAIKAHYVMEA